MFIKKLLIKLRLIEDESQKIKKLQEIIDHKNNDILYLNALLSKESRQKFADKYKEKDK